ncbi:MAG: PRD domain-containing protein [Chloroflexi bacterium]|nr:PRD domain-containing protein [Chloroflexota bacterium]
MKVRKVINNNVVSSTDDDHNEVVVMGKGIGFQKREGDLIQDSIIEKIFILNDKNILSKLENLFKDIPEKYLEITDEIIQYAQSQYGLSLREHAYLSLTDHIAIAVERIKSGIKIENVMLSDIKCFYKNEYEIGLKALEIIDREMGVILPDDEAGFIALHVLNASLDQINANNLETIKISHEILNIVNDFYKLSLDKESIHYYRFANHVNYLVKRLFSQSEEVESDDILYETVRKNFTREFECANLIKRRIYENYGISISKEELGYLIINLRALLKNINV